MIFRRFGIEVDSDILCEMLGKHVEIVPTFKYIEYVRNKKIEDIFE